MYRDVGMSVPKTTETRCRDGSVQAVWVNECSWLVSICSASSWRYWLEFALSRLAGPWPGPRKNLCPSGHCGENLMLVIVGVGMAI